MPTYTRPTQTKLLRVPPAANSPGPGSSFLMGGRIKRDDSALVVPHEPSLLPVQSLNLVPPVRPTRRASSALDPAPTTHSQTRK